MHELIIGPTMCGKTTLGFEKARAFLARGVHVLVCDPYLNDWPCTWLTTDRKKFIEVAKRSRRCALFVDEAGQTIARDSDAEWIVTGARHWGHLTHILGQGGTQMHPIMRDQCATVNLFGCTPAVAERFAEEFNEPGLLAAVNLPRFHFLRKTRFQPLRGPLKLAL